MQSQLSEEELARLKALRDCHVLDTPPEELFDQSARLAAYLCGTPIGLIGFIDATPHWFKSRVGWDYPEIPREHSICAQTILHRDLLVIPDAAMDERFFNVPMVTRAGIRFYAGAPLLTTEGHALGTLCVMDRLPRELPAGHKDALLTLAHLVEAQLEVRRGTTASAPVENNPSLIEGTAVNISEHKRADEALRDSQERLLGIISSAVDAIITVDDDQKIVSLTGPQNKSSAAQQPRPLGRRSISSSHRDSMRLIGDTFGASGKLAFPAAPWNRLER